MTLTERAQRWNRYLDEHLLKPIYHCTYILMKSTVWGVFVAAYALSALVFVIWCRHVWVQLVLNTPEDLKSLIHTVLLAVELLILVPVPGVVGIVAYQTLVHIGHPDAPDLEASEHQVKVGERLLWGLLVTITGTTLVDSLISGAAKMEIMVGGAMLIASLGGVIYFSRQK